ncbi:MAG: penicillin acylase family protein, partial [Pseudomonadota bacterium]
MISTIFLAEALIEFMVATTCETAVPPLTATSEAQAAKAKGSTPSVTIRTTEYGIPRILADNWKGIGYGYGYSIAK